ncbi:Glycosyltransferase involved in cell wall bisynthesis [Evansella caseinilytica]|uniref:Glycosyltransferase involved in cell wall bisynthesis n=1 Tax=Evansella caseinilytica TaxID=1503961 RepID=A0A1H3HMJ8_9BACI|nr:glycosyltransferase family 4 protein [Evansella caseinilytica]SDY16756.1 Glycosyltransferase involved in cell wall bisynthesis [Evansella caseinilytica]
MKILHLPYGIGISTLAKALREQGANAASCSFRSTNFYDYLADIRLNLNQYSIKKSDSVRRQFFRQAMAEYDLFHFHFGETFFPDKRDLRELKNAGKKRIVHHRGSEVRKLSVARSFGNPYVQVKKSWPEKTITNNLTKLSADIDHAIVNDHELLAYVKPYYKKTYVVRQPLDCSRFQPVYPSPQKKPLIVHAPSNREIKGTEFVIKAMEQLKQDGEQFTFRLIEKLPREEALALYRKAAIIIDQLRIGSYANFSLEAMALGKPVVCFIRNDLLKTYPPDLPIVNANPDTIYEEVKKLLHEPEAWAKIGKRSRKYVEGHHRPDAIAKQLLQIYSEL